MRGLRRFSTLLVLGTAGVVAIASAGPRVQPSRFFATPIKPQPRKSSQHGRHHRAPPARMLVYAQEWSLWPSRNSVPAGRVTVQLWNRGEDSHDLRIQQLGPGGTPIGRIQGVAITRSGGLGHSTWKLKPGHYVLYCSLPEHYQRGMHTTLVVR